MARAARETDGEAEGVEIWTVDGVLAVEGGTIAMVTQWN